MIRALLLLSFYCTLVSVYAAPAALPGFGRPEPGLLDAASSRLTDDGFIDWNSLYAAEKRKQILEEAKSGHPLLVPAPLADSTNDFPVYGLDEDGDHFQNWNSMFDRPHAHLRRSGVYMKPSPSGDNQRNGLKFDY